MRSVRSMSEGIIFRNQGHSRGNNVCLWLQLDVPLTNAPDYGK
jgi:hypothetical protein